MKKKCLVVGASGYLGNEVCTQLRAPEETLGTYLKKPIPNFIQYDFFKHSIGDILEQNKGVESIIFAASVERHDVEDVLFFAAVDRFVDQVKANNLRLVYISSDAVFSGAKGRYLETDPPDSTTQYGRNLRVFENSIKENLENYVIVRFSYLYGNTSLHTDRRLADVIEEVGKGKKVKRYSNVYKSPVHVIDVSRKIVSLLNSGVTGFFHLPGDKISIFDFYQRQCANLTLNADLIISEEVSEDADIAMDTSLLSINTFMEKL